MKKRIVLALIATLTLTVGSFGTAFAMNSTPTIELQTNENLKQAEEPEHTHTWGDEEYIVTKPAEYEQIKVVDKEAVYEQIKVVDKEAEYEQIKVVDQEAWDEEITGVKTVCYLCQEQGINTYFANGKVEGTDISIIQHCKDNHGGASHYGQEEVVVDVIHHEEVFHYENGALISPEEFHYENGALISPEEFHYENGALISPEEGYWEHTCSVCGEIQNKDTGEVIKPGTLPEEPTEPEEPENPDSGDVTDPTDPETPETDDPTTEEPENPNTGDNTGDQTETPNEDTQNSTDKTETDNNEQEQQDNDKTTTTDTTDKSENTDTATTVSNENKAPQTGDTASLIYLATLAGSAVTGGTAFGLRRKFKK